jgi:hypothetical protein
MNRSCLLNESHHHCGTHNRMNHLLMQYAANLWVWNTPRQGYPGSPRNPNMKKKQGDTVEAGGVTGVTATFRNSGKNPDLKNAELFFEDTFWARLGSDGPPVSVNTYRGHLWKLMVDGTEIQRWTIETDVGKKTFLV